MDNINDVLEIINKINEFYEASWNKLIIAAVFILGVIGVIWPIITSWYQSRKFKLDESNFRNNIEKYIDEKFINLEKKFEEYSQINEKNILEKIDKFKLEISNVRGGAFHIQGISAKKEKNYILAITSLITSANLYIKSQDEMNLQRVLNVLLEDCLPHINSTTIEDYDDIDININDLFKNLVDFNENARYSDILSRLKKAYKKAKNRKEKQSSN